MPDTPLRPPSPDDSQFDAADSVDQSAEDGEVCALCGQPIVSTYFHLGDRLLCPACRDEAIAPPAGSRFGRLARASLMGLGAGLIGAIVWFAIRRMAGLELGLIAIVVGLMVGKAVHKGSGEIGGRGYQVLAVLITYCCIAANYMPDILEGVMEAARKNDAVAAPEGGAKAANANDEKPAEARKPRDVNFARAAVALAIVLALVLVLSGALSGWHAEPDRPAHHQLRLVGSLEIQPASSATDHRAV